MGDVVQPAQWKWASRFIGLAHGIATWSKDPSTQVGAVAVGDAKQILSTGYNGLPRGVRDDTGRMQRPGKYLWTVHAEANLAAHAARSGVSLRHATVYVTHCPCAQHTAHLINAGVHKVVYDTSGMTNMDPVQFETAKTMFAEAEIQLLEYTHRVEGTDNAG